MRTFPDIRMRRFMATYEQAQADSKNGDYTVAAARFVKLDGELSALNIKSAALAWNIAVAYDMAGEVETALRTILPALERDPFNPGTQASLSIIVRRLRALLTEAAAPDQSVSRWYSLLQSVGEVDEASHLAMSRHLAAVGQVEAAAKLLDAVMLTSPASSEVWAARAALARQMGDATAAAQFEKEASAAVEE